MNKKVLKIVFPIIGLFLVIYLAFNTMNVVKMNGIVTQMNDQLNEDFVIISSTIGNVFFDESFLVTARSEKTGYIYDFPYEEGIVDTTSYALENEARKLTVELQKSIDLTSVLFVNDVSEKQGNTVTFVTAKNEMTEDQINQIIEYLKNQQFSVKHYMGDAQQIKKFQDDVLAFYPFTEITPSMLSYYKLVKQ